MKNNLIRNPWAFVLAGLTAGVLLLVFNSIISARLSPAQISAQPVTGLLATELDDHGSVMAAILTDDGAVAQTVASDQQAIYLIGGSTLREGLLPDAVIENVVIEEFDRQASIVTLYSFDQSIAETSRIALNLPLDSGDVVVVDVNPRRLGLPRETLTAEWADSRISLLELDPLAELADKTFDDGDRSGRAGPGASIAMIGESRALAPWKMLSVFENRLFLRSWLEGRLSGDTTTSWSALTSGQFNDVSVGAVTDFSLRGLRRPLRYAFGTEPLSAQQKDEIAWTVRTQRVAAYFENREFQLRLLTALVDELELLDIKVILLELPRSQLSVEAYGPVWDDYDERLRQLATRANVQRVDLRDANFDDDDYYDLEHLLAPSREPLTDLVLRGILGED